MNSFLFINSYLDKISTKFDVNYDDAFEIFAIATILDIQNHTEIKKEILLKI